ncbi:hypothetical protein GFGA_1c1190 [Gluconobacter frateurii NBRC 103465]|nr:hypothetical protein GFGA_1c1190 [Gluconobacter frateurii NBRC 103465]
MTAHRGCQHQVPFLSKPAPADARQPAHPWHPVAPEEPAAEERADPDRREYHAPHGEHSSRNKPLGKETGLAAQPYGWRA